MQLYKPSVTFRLWSCVIHMQICEKQLLQNAFINKCAIFYYLFTLAVFNLTMQETLKLSAMLLAIDERNTTTYLLKHKTVLSIEIYRGDFWLC